MYWKLLDYHYIFYGQVLENYLLSAKGTALDAGCGRKGGSLTYQASVGVDISRKNLKSSKLLRPKTSYILADITHLPFKTASFNTIICVDVLEHVMDKTNAISEISRVSQPEALFVGSTSNLLNPIIAFDSFAPKGIVKVLTEKYAKGHYERHFRFTSATLANSLKKAGFILSTTRLLGFPPFTPWIYQNNPDLKPPWFARLWIISDRVMTKIRPLSLMKEAIVFRAVRSSLPAEMN